MSLSKLVTVTKYDELVGGTYPPLLTANVTFAGATETLLRGTLVAKNADGKYVAVDSTQTVGVGVLAQDLIIDGEDTVGTIYTSGMFNRNRLILKEESDDINVHEDELRMMNIYLTKITDVDVVAQVDTAAITGEAITGETTVGGDKN